MNENIEKMKKYAGQGFVKGLVVAALSDGERLDISPTSALQTKLGKMLHGTRVGLVRNGQPIELPEDIFYEIADLKIDGAADDLVFRNLKRTDIAVANKFDVKKIMMVIFLISSGVLAVYGWMHGGSQLFKQSQQPQVQQYRPY